MQQKPRERTLIDSKYDGYSGSKGNETTLPNESLKIKTINSLQAVVLERIMKQLI